MTFRSDWKTGPAIEVAVRIAITIFEWLHEKIKERKKNP